MASTTATSTIATETPLCSSTSCDDTCHDTPMDDQHHSPQTTASSPSTLAGLSRQGCSTTATTAPDEPLVTIPSPASSSGPAQATHHNREDHQSPPPPPPPSPPSSPAPHLPATTKASPPPPLFEVRASPLGGSGVFALHDIPEGQVVLAERPLFYADRITLYEEVDRLEPSDRIQFDSLHVFRRTVGTDDIAGRFWTNW